MARRDLNFLLMEACTVVAREVIILQGITIFEDEAEKFNILQKGLKTGSPLVQLELVPPVLVRHWQKPVPPVLVRRAGLAGTDSPLLVDWLVSQVLVGQ